MKSALEYNFGDLYIQMVVIKQKLQREDLCVVLQRKGRTIKLVPSSILEKKLSKGTCKRRKIELEKVKEACEWEIWFSTTHLECQKSRVGGLLDLNLYGDVPTNLFFFPAPEFLPSNDTRFYRKFVKVYSKTQKTGLSNNPI